MSPLASFLPSPCKRTAEYSSALHMMKDDNDEIFRVPFLGLFRDPELGQVSTCLSVIYGDIYECSTEIPFPQLNSLIGGGGEFSRAIRLVDD